MSFLGYGSTQSASNGTGASSSSPTGGDDYFSQGVNEKTPLDPNGYQPQQHQQRGPRSSQEHSHSHGCSHHGPGEHCSLPEIMQPLVNPLNHDVVENVVIKVMDGADHAQKAVFHFWDEWREFVNRGGTVDLALGVVIGGAFSDIIDSFVADILTPPLSLWATGTNLENSFFVLRHGRTPGKKYATYLEAQADGAVTENTGQFLKACCNFLAIAFMLFWIVKGVHSIRREKIKPPPKEKTCLWCGEQIRLEAFRCRYCHSYVKNVPGLEDASVGMFVAVKKKHNRPQSQAFEGGVQSPEQGLGSGATLVPGQNASTTATVGPADGKKIAAALASIDDLSPK
ncbi:hypothetical protein MVEG_05387 [Podila verticillata NRRL 6337]|nr:hypothetical protein MVEG_05387 [Podila verticillata NRRL 6337]